MNYQQVLSQALVNGLGVTLGVVLGLVTVTPMLKYFYSETPRRSVEQKKENKQSATDLSRSVYTESAQSNVDMDYKELFD